MSVKEKMLPYMDPEEEFLKLISDPSINCDKLRNRQIFSRFLDSGRHLDEIGQSLATTQTSNFKWMDYKILYFESTREYSLAMKLSPINWFDRPMKWDNYDSFSAYLFWNKNIYNFEWIRLKMLP